jgi:hypothetical protein
MKLYGAVMPMQWHVHITNITAVQNSRNLADGPLM